MDHGLLIGGTERPAANGATFASVDPANGQPIATFARATRSDVDSAVAAARAAFRGEWRYTSAADRGRLLQRMSARLLAELEPLARDEARDSGKRLELARTDVRIAARYLEFFGNLATSLTGEQIPVSADVVDFTSREPYGVCAQINAWNFPLNMAARSLAAALAAGNVVVVKTPELAPLNTAALGRIATGCGVPAGVVNILHGYGAEAGAALAAHPGVDLVTFTGSIATGSKVATAAAANVVPCVMELGGKSPTLVFPDADLTTAADQLATGFVDANGQSCDLPSRALVHRDVYEQFVGLLATRVEKFTLGPGIDDPDVGALISGPARDRVAAYVDGARAAGARVVCGGELPADPALSTGWYYPPTVLADVTPEMAVAREEIFGPVLSVLPFDDEAHAVDLANGTDYGLAAFVWTSDVTRAMRLSKRIEAGQVYVNCFSSGDGVMTPFGGFKRSGYGREKGAAALATYSQLKNVCIAAA